MKNLWAPWRIEYILGPKADECVFCIPESPYQDRQKLILKRAKHCIVIMNRFPYSNGHLMLAPYRHVKCLTEISSGESAEMMGLLQISCRILRKEFCPHGINIGLNLGEAAGAGIEEHLHFHLVPRWVGDFSFMAVMSDTSIIPEHLSAVYDRMRAHFETYT